MWECPDFFALGTKHVLLHSTAGGVYWETGELDPKELVFHPDKLGMLDYGAYYAQKTQLDARGNRILWGWITEKRSDDELRAAGWAGCMALPRVLSIGADGALEMRFVPEVKPLRGEAFEVLGFSSPEKRESAMKAVEIENVAGEFLWESAEQTFRLKLIDRTGSWFDVSLDLQGGRPKLAVNGRSIDLPAAKNAAHTFHLFLDGSVAELICDDRHVITERLYRKPDGPLRVSGDSSMGRLRRLIAWQVKPISPDRLTT
jgi:beta-fructofuranosidase